MHSPEPTPTFLAGTYRGHHIAVFQHGGGWLAYLDRVLQVNRLFETANEATAWLCRRIDDRLCTRPLRPSQLPDVMRD